MSERGLKSAAEEIRDGDRGEAIGRGLVISGFAFAVTVLPFLVFAQPWPLGFCAVLAFLAAYAGCFGLARAEGAGRAPGNRPSNEFWIVFLMAGVISLATMMAVLRHLPEARVAAWALLLWPFFAGFFSGLNGGGAVRGLRWQEILACMEAHGRVLRAQRKGKG